MPKLSFILVSGSHELFSTWLIHIIHYNYLLLSKTVLLVVIIISIHSLYWVNFSYFNDNYYNFI